jgi:hypothetical protein
MAGAAETTPLMLDAEDNPRSLEAKEARQQMRRENAARSLPKSAIRALERRKGARR